MNSKKLVIAFDVDDTLIIPTIALPAIKHPKCGFRTFDGVPNFEVINIYRFLQQQGHTMVIWSMGGEEYAENVANYLDLRPDYIWKKEKDSRVDIAFDDCDVDLGKVNVKVKRINNQISRKEWNEHS